MNLIRKIGVALAVTFAVVAMAPTAAHAGKPAPAPSAPPRLVAPPAFSTQAVYRAEVRVLHCFDESEAFSDEIEIWRESDGGYFNVRNIDDVDGAILCGKSLAGLPRFGLQTRVTPGCAPGALGRQAGGADRHAGDAPAKREAAHQHHEGMQLHKAVAATK